MKDYFFNILKEVNNNNCKKGNLNDSFDLVNQSKDENNKRNELFINVNHEASIIKYSNSINFLMSLLKDSDGKERKMYINMALNLIEKLKNNIFKHQVKVQTHSLDTIKKYLKSLKNSKSTNYNNINELNLNLFLLDENEDKLFNSSINNISSYKSDSECWNMSEKTRDKSKSSCKEKQETLQEIESYNSYSNCNSSSNIINIDELFNFEDHFLGIQNELSKEEYINLNFKNDENTKISFNSNVDLVNIFDNYSDSKFDEISINENYNPTNEITRKNQNLLVDFNSTNVKNYKVISKFKSDNFEKLAKIPEFLSDKLITNSYATKCKTDLSLFLSCKRLYAEDKIQKLISKFDSISDKEVNPNLKNKNHIYLKQYNNLFLNE
jgi:hypothetical protein